MSHFYHHAGQLQSLPLTWLDSLGFRMGIRPFTTLRHDGQRAQLWAYHEQRLRIAMSSWGATQQVEDELINQCLIFLTNWKHANIIRIDLVLLEEGHFDWFATLRDVVNLDQDVLFKVVNDHLRTCRGDGRIKYAHYQKEELLKRELKSQKELLFEHEVMGLQEASTSNIMLWNHGGLVLPAQSEKGILEGIYLRAFCDFLRQENIDIKTEKLFHQSLTQESLLVLSNCAKGFRRARGDDKFWSVSQERLWQELKEYEREFLNFSTTG